MKTKPTLKSSEDKTFICLPAGSTVCKLNKVEFKDFPSFDNPEVMEEKIVFRFEPSQMELKPDEKCMISKKFTFSGHEKATLRKIVRMMQANIPESLWNDEEAYWNLVKSFEGKEWLVIHEPDKTKKYNNLVSVLPIHGQPVTVKPKLKQSESISTPLDLADLDNIPAIQDDDIPF